MYNAIAAVKGHRDAAAAGIAEFVGKRNPAAQGRRRCRSSRRIASAHDAIAVREAGTRPSPRSGQPPRNRRRGWFGDRVEAETGADVSELMRPRERDADTPLPGWGSGDSRCRDVRRQCRDGPAHGAAIILEGRGIARLHQRRACPFGRRRAAPSSAFCGCKRFSIDRIRPTVRNHTSSVTRHTSAGRQ